MSPRILLLSLGTTIGLQAGDAVLAGMLRAAGVSVEVVQVRIGAAAALRRAYPVTDLVEAIAARRALAQALPRVRPDAVIFSSTTSSLLAPRLDVPYAVRLDAPARLNRPGARNALQHLLERRRLRAARVVLPFSRSAAEALPPGAAPAIVVPQPIELSGPQPPGRHLPPQTAASAPPPQTQSPSMQHPSARERLVVAYTPDPKAKGLDIVVSAWAQAKIADARLEVFGLSPELARAHLARRHVAEPPGITWRGRVSAEEFRAALRAAHVFLTGARWEDYGFAQLEALADGALLVCGATGGAFEALRHAHELAPALCADDLQPSSLALALRRAFAMTEAEAERYQEAASARMEAYRPQAIRALIAERVLPTLLR